MANTRTTTVKLLCLLLLYLLFIEVIVIQVILNFFIWNYRFLFHLLTHVKKHICTSQKCTKVHKNWRSILDELNIYWLHDNYIELQFNYKVICRKHNFHFRYRDDTGTVQGRYTTGTSNGVRIVTKCHEI